MNSLNKTARMAGLFYLLYIITTILTDVLGRSKLIVYGEAAMTARNIMAAEWPFRLMFVGELVSAVLFFLAASGLYMLLKPVHPGIALSFVLLNAAGTSVYAVNVLNQLAALLQRPQAREDACRRTAC